MERPDERLIAGRTIAEYHIRQRPALRAHVPDAVAIDDVQLVDDEIVDPISVHVPDERDVARRAA